VTSGRQVAVIAAVGLGTGVLSQLAQDLLPDGWSQIGNSLSPWLLVAFLLGSTMPDRRWAVAAGVGALVLALVGYYATTTLRFGIGGGTSSLVFWGLGAFIGGAVFGLAGRAWRTAPDRWVRAFAVGLVTAAFIAEGVYLLGILPDPAVGRGFILAGAVVPLVLGRTWPDRARSYVAVAPALVLGAVGYVVFLAIYGVTSSIG
jgi:hypothetical protein